MELRFVGRGAFVDIDVRKLRMLEWREILRKVLCGGCGRELAVRRGRDGGGGIGSQGDIGGGQLARC